MKISERELPENVKTRLELVPNFLMIGTLCVMMASQFMSWRVEAIRKMEIKKCREEKSRSPLYFLIIHLEMCIVSEQYLK